MKWNTLTDLIRQKKNVFHLVGRYFEVFQSEKKKKRGRRKVKGRIRKTENNIEHQCDTIQKDVSHRHS